jgi:Ca2+-binding EF-hand superfamily protein
MAESPKAVQNKKDALKERKNPKKKEADPTEIVDIAKKANVKGPSASAQAAVQIGGKRGQALESSPDGKNPKAQKKGGRKEKDKKGKKGKKGKGDGRIMDDEAAERKKKRKNAGLWKKFKRMICGTGEIPVLKDAKAIEAVEALNLKPHHLAKIKARFDDIDIDGSGSIDSTELFEALGEPRSPFTDAVFAIIDIDGSGLIEFEEFVRIMATYCMYTQDEILRFCFEMFDKDGSGAIDERELVELCKYECFYCLFCCTFNCLVILYVFRAVNNAAPVYPGNFKKALEEFDVNDVRLCLSGKFSLIC